MMDQVSWEERTNVECFTSRSAFGSPHFSGPTIDRRHSYNAACSDSSLLWKSGEKCGEKLAKSATIGLYKEYYRTLLRSRIESCCAAHKGTTKHISLAKQHSLFRQSKNCSIYLSMCVNTTI